MPSLHPQDRISLCHFTFSDGRRCRTPRAAAHPDFCHYHAEKDARDRTAAQLGNDFATLFSGTYISACDLSPAIARLMAAVARGHVKPRTARTLAYLAQTLLQSVRCSQHEFIATFGNTAWRKSIGESLNHNLRYLRDLPQPKSAAESPAAPPPQPQPALPSERASHKTTASPDTAHRSAAAIPAAHASHRRNGAPPPHFRNQTPVTQLESPDSQSAGAD